MYAVGVIATMFTIGVVVGLFFIPIPDKNRDVLFSAVGSILTAYLTIIAFLFGSSKSSVDKTDIMNQTQQK